jgi:hypothetical protein
VASVAPFDVSLPVLSAHKHARIESIRLAWKRERENTNSRPLLGGDDGILNV